MPVRAAVIFALLTLGACGCQADDPPGEEEEPAVEQSQPVPSQPTLVEVPDVTGMDGQDAVDAIEAEELTATHDELDPAECVVEDQDETGEVEPETEVVLTLDCRQRDWEAREGDDWDLFASSFASGASEGCDALFALSPEGSLYDGDTEYTSTDCTIAVDDDPESANVEVPEEVPDDAETVGQALGFEHGCSALFDAELLDTLFHGEDSFTAADCQAATARSPPAP